MCSATAAPLFQLWSVPDPSRGARKEFCALGDMSMMVLTRQPKALVLRWMRPKHGSPRHVYPSMTRKKSLGMLSAGTFCQCSSAWHTCKCTPKVRPKFRQNAALWLTLPTEPGAWRSDNDTKDVNASSGKCAFVYTYAAKLPT